MVWGPAQDHTHHRYKWALSHFDSTILDCSIFAFIPLIMLFFFLYLMLCRSATASQCLMAYTKEDQPAVRDQVTQSALMEAEVPVEVEESEAPSPTLSARRSWQIPNNRGPMREVMQLQQTCCETTCPGPLHLILLAPSARPPARQTWPATGTAALGAAVRNWSPAWCSCQSRPSSRTAPPWFISPCRRLVNR